jgi:hypothetical protein
MYFPNNGPAEALIVSIEYSSQALWFGYMTYMHTH